MKILNTLHDEQIRVVDYGSPAYADIVSLRFEVLRKPLNLQFTAEQLALEKDYFHLGLYKNNMLVACLMLVFEGRKMKMKQVAVLPSEQGKGYGAKLVLAAEAFAKDMNCSLMYCHARDTAVPFYQKLQYQKVGDMFEEVTIPHFQMEKNL